MNLLIWSTLLVLIAIAAYIVGINNCVLANEYGPLCRFWSIFSDLLYHFSPGDSKICLRQDTQIAMGDGTVKQIKDIVTGDSLLSGFGTVVTVEKLLSSSLRPTVCVKKHALGTNVPHADLYITRTHPLYVNGQYRLPKDLVNGRDIVDVLNDDTPLYNILLVEGLASFVANGIPVAGAPPRFAPDAEVPPLISATLENDRRLVEDLLGDASVDVNAANEKSLTALQYAAYHGYASIVDALLKHPDIDVNQQSWSGFTALHQAAAKGHVKILRLLLEHPDVIPDNKSVLLKTPLDVAREEGVDETVVEMLHRGTRLSV